MDSVLIANDLEIKCRLLDDYKQFICLRRIAEKEGAVKTVKEINLLS